MPVREIEGELALPRQWERPLLDAFQPATPRPGWPIQRVAAALH